MIHNLQSLTAPVIPSLHQPSGVQLPQPQVRAQRVKALFVFWVPCLGLQINWAGFCDQKAKSIFMSKEQRGHSRVWMKPFSVVRGWDGVQYYSEVGWYHFFIQQIDRTKHLDFTGGIPRVLIWRITAHLCITLPHRCFNHSFTPNPGTASKPNRVMRSGVHSVQQHSLLCDIF